jgi:outer membrane cobalamin receptor
MANRIGRVALGAALLLFSRLIGAQDQDLPTFELDAVTVTASRISEPASESPPAVSVVSASEIEAQGATTVAEALSDVPGLSLSDKGPAGSQVSVSLRGSTTNQVLVLIDGIRANDALTGLVDISAIPLDSVERMEIMRGGGSSLYGGDALGGVINIITKKKASPLALVLENGSYLPTARVAGFGWQKVAQPASAKSLVDSQKASFSWGPAVGDAVLRLAGSATRAANAYTFIDSNSDKRELQNAALLGANASLGATVPLDSGKIMADVAGAWSRVGVPGLQSQPTLGAAEVDTSARATLKYSTERFLTDLLSLDATAHAEYAGIDYTDTATPANDGHHKIVTAGADFAQTAYATDWLTLAYGTSLSYASAWSDAVGSPQRFAGGAYIEPAFTVGSLSIRPSIRYDFYSDFSPRYPYGGIGGALGTAYKLSDSDVLKLDLSRAFRVPTFNDLYWPAQGGAAGNPDLKPETAYEADVGFERRQGTLRYTATAYLRYSQDVILWQPGTDGVWRPSNFGTALYPGLEQEVAARFAERYTISANYSYLYSYVLSGGLSLSDDKRLPMTSVHHLKGSLSYEGERLSWSATGSYASLRYLKTANVAYLPAWFTLDAILRWKASKVVSAYVAGDNIFDEQYAIIDGYPMPGTKIRVGIELKY